jgi:hypothetical protein
MNPADVFYGYVAGVSDSLEAQDKVCIPKNKSGREVVAYVSKEIRKARSEDVFFVTKLQ